MAEELRSLLADASGFWLKPGQDAALYALVVRHRVECEQRIIDQLNLSANRFRPSSTHLLKRRGPPLPRA
jgi:hypothetical protein